MISTAVISPCGLFRYLLERDYEISGITIGFVGCNPSKAEARVEDQSTKKLRVFALRNGARRWILANVFAFRSPYVARLRNEPDPVGPDNERYLNELIAAADVIVPCWGDSLKLPKNLRRHFSETWEKLLKSGKPIKIFGTTKGGDPKHPLMLGYDTKLIEIRSGLVDSAGLPLRRRQGIDA